jgi:hypothetical protein
MEGDEALMALATPPALFCPEGRKTLAHTLVWGSDERLEFYSHAGIEHRVVLALERIAAAIQKERFAPHTCVDRPNLSCKACGAGQ